MQRRGVCAVAWLVDPSRWRRPSVRSVPPPRRLIDRLRSSTFGVGAVAGWDSSAFYPAAFGGRQTCVSSPRLDRIEMAKVNENILSLSVPGNCILEAAMVRGEGITIARGVSAVEAFDFVLDPAQYTKADTKMLWVTKLADIPNGMLAREDGKFLGRFKGSVITRYRWDRPNHIDVTLEHGVPRSLHAWFEIEDEPGGVRIRHVEELDLGHGILGAIHDRVAGRWFAQSVRDEVAEIGRLLEDGQRGRAFDDFND